MPKANNYPLSVLFGINKPSGPPSMTVLNQLQPLFSSSILFKDPNSQSNNNNGGGGGKGKWNKKGKGRRNEERIKLGQGGTLDPLADGVLVVGTNSATKHLAQFLDCTKEYKAIGLFGCSTDSYDSEGKRVNMMPYSQITKEKIEAILDQYRGEIEQVPPIFSALKMDGKPLYEYARNGIPLPRPIAARKVTVFSLSLLRFTEASGHSYVYPKEELGESEKVELAKLQKMVKDGEILVKEEEVVEPVAAPEEIVDESASSPPIFEISMTVSSGTYVRSIIHDIGIALGSAAHVVKLTRTRQGIFALNDNLSPPTIVESESKVEQVVDESIPIVVESTPILEATIPTEETAPAASIAEVEVEASTSTLKEEIAPIIPISTSSTTATPTAEVETFSGGCVEWEVLESAIKDMEASRKSGEALKRNEEGFLPWEVEVLHRCKAI